MVLYLFFVCFCCFIAHWGFKKTKQKDQEKYDQRVWTRACVSTYKPNVSRQPIALRGLNRSRKKETFILFIVIFASPDPSSGSGRRGHSEWSVCVLHVPVSLQSQHFYTVLL